MFYTILFTDAALRTQGILVVELNAGNTSPVIVCHASEGSDYVYAYLLTENGFSDEPFYTKDGTESGDLMHYALQALPLPV